MSSGAPWSVKGIDPRARAVAKTAARKEGMTLGEWLNRVILDDGEPAPWDGALERYPGFGGDDESAALNAVVERLTDRLEAAERRSTQALSGVDQSVLAITRRLDALEERSEDGGEALETALSRTRDQQDELLARVRKLERTGPSGGGDPAALKAVESTIGKLAGRLYETERDVRAELDNLAHKEEHRRDTAEKSARKLGERIDETERRLAGEQRDLRERLDQESQRAGDLRSGLEDQARSLQSRIIAAESATHRAAEALVQSQERLDARLRTLESSGGVGSKDINRRFDTLGRELAGLIHATREDCAQRVAEVAKTGVDGQRMERALEAAEARLSQAEARQTEALTRIGDEVSRLARAVDRRIEEAERRLEQKLTQSEDRHEGRRSRSDFDSRLERVREENTAAVRRIGEQMARLGENLADRVQQAELRSAAAVEQAGERMAQVVEKLETQHTSEKSADLESRIQASEERTVYRLEQAMEGVHKRLDQARTETADALSPVQRAMTALAERLEAIEQNKTEPQQAASEPAESEPSPSAEAAQPADTLDFSTPLPQPPGLEPARDDWADDTGDSFVMEAEAAPQAAAPASAPAYEPEFREPRAPDEFDETPQTAQRRARSVGATADADFLAAARKTVRANGGGTASQWSDPEEPKPNTSGRTLLIGASILGFGAVAAAAGMLALEAINGGAEPAARTAQTASPETLSTLFADPAPAPATTQPSEDGASAVSSVAPDDAVAPGPATAEPAAPVLADPEPVRTAAATPVADPDASLAAAVRVVAPSLDEAAASGDAIARYQLAMVRLSEGQLADAAALMRRAAEQGVPDAMRRYGLMLTRGEGVAQDAQAGREFVVRAAEAGNVQAMHDAGGLFINAPETPETQAAAARWFQEAALHGLSDSQFNMALLFQEGFGVPQSTADAYTWFLIAANGGDSDAGDRATRLRPSLSPGARAEAERTAANFQPRPVNAEAQGQYPPQSWNASPEQLTARAQALLANLGYDAGPADGVLGERTRRAIVRYQRDAGLEPGAPLNASLVARLEQSAAN
jgi:localization factor PodJL